MRYSLLLLVTFLTSCIHISLNNLPPKPGDTLLLKGNLNIPDSTANYLHTFRSFSTGLAYRYTVDVGEALVTYANYYIDTEESDTGNILEITIEHFVIQNAVANLTTKFVITDKYERVIFEETYITNGQKHIMSWGINSLLRKTTDDALSSAFEQFSLDIFEENDPRLKKIIFHL